MNYFNLNFILFKIIECFEEAIKIIKRNMHLHETLTELLNSEKVLIASVIFELANHYTV